MCALALFAFAFFAAAEPASAKPLCQGKQATIKGTPETETIEGTEQADVIRARAGNDTIIGLGGDDVVCGGLGADQAETGEGSDSVNGGEGNDTTTLGGGDDHFFGHTGDDVATGGAGIDECRAEQHTECEADLRINLTGPTNPAEFPAGGVTHGDETVYLFNINVRNNGLTTTVNSRADLTLPQDPDLGPVEFVAASSDSRCASTTATTVRCAFSAIGVDNADEAVIGLRFPECFTQGNNLVARRGEGEFQTAALTGTTTDAGTSDPVSSNDADAHAFPYFFSFACTA
jgi:hypothetical protein